MNKKTDIKVILKDKNGQATEEGVIAVSSVNERGPFDILGLHENFITVIKNKVILHKKDGSKKEITLTRGVIKNNQNEVSIYLGV